MQGELGAWLDAASGTDEEFVDRIWRLAVRRPPEPHGRERALAKLGDGTLSRAGLLRERFPNRRRGAAVDGDHLHADAKP